jgi:hypothetical protein
MAEAEAVEAVEEVSNDAPILNPASAEETSPELQQEQPIPLHEEAQPEPVHTTDMDDGEPIERPDYYPEKFWDEDGPDVEKLAKSYAELEKKFKSGKHKAPEGDYDVSAFQDMGLEQDDPMLDQFSAWAKENGISQEAFEGMVNQYMELAGGEFEKSEYNRQQEIQKLGENAQQKIEMADRLLMKAPLSDAEREAIANNLNTAEAINGFLKYHQSITNEGIPARPQPSMPNISREELETHIADPRWQSDPAWRSRIEKLWLESQV